MGVGMWGWGMGVWELGIGDCAQSPIPNPQSPIPNPQSPYIVLNIINYFKINFFQKDKLDLNNN